MHLHAAIVTLLASLLLAFAVGLVGRARGRYGIHAPATTGHPDFERVFRAQMNQLEQGVVFLPVFWLATLHFHPQYAAWLGYAWVIGRLYYILAYAKDAKARGPGFLIGSIALFGLLAMATWGLGAALLAR